MRFLLNCSSSDSDYSADCDYAVVDIDKKSARLILSRRKAFVSLKDKDDALWEMYFWDCNVYFVSHTPQFNKYRKDTMFGAGRVEFLASIVVDPDTVQRTECEQMIIREDGVSWTALPKYADGIYLTTAAIDFKSIEELI